MQLSAIMQLECALIFLITQRCLAKPAWNFDEPKQARNSAYNYADKAIQGASPIEDHSAHLENVANAYHATDHVYHNYPNADTLQPVPHVQTGKVMEHAEKEVEHPYSAVQTFYENKHQQVNNKFERKPLIDTIQHHEKFGNTGDMFMPLTRGIVNVFEFMANILNKSIQGSEHVVRKPIKIATDQLDQLGAKIVGL